MTSDTPVNQTADARERRDGDGGEEEENHNHNRIYSRRTPRESETEQGTQIWLISFTDVMALMLTFFVLLFSMAEPEPERWTEMMSALNNEFNRYYGAPLDRGPVEEINLDRVDYDEALSLDYLNALISALVEDTEALAGTELITLPSHLVLSMPQEFLFAPGQAEIRDEGAKALYALGGALSRIKNKIEIIGHSDPRPVSAGGGGFSSNWDLSLARAAEVAGVLNNVGYEREIGIRGLASGRYQDLEGAVDEEERLELARRVDILIYSHGGRKNDLLFAPVIR